MAPSVFTVIAMAALAAGPAPVTGPARRAESPSLASLEAEQSSLFARVAPSVVLLVRDGASGSGFVVGPGGLVLTNAHVVGEADEVNVQLSDGRYGRGRVVARATGALDLALVRIPFEDVPPLPAGDPGALRSGTFAATVGHGGGAAWTFSTGLIANPRPLGDGAPLILAQMALRPGSSGGPLVDRLGRAVAVVTAGTRDASGVTFAIRIDAAAAAFPQLAAWSAPPPTGPEGPAPATSADPREGVAIAPAEPSDRTSGVARLAAGGTSFATWTPRGDAEAPSRMVTVWEAPRAIRPARAKAEPQRQAGAPAAVEPPRDEARERGVQPIPGASAPPRALVYLLVASALVAGGVATGAVLAGRSHSPR